MNIQDQVTKERELNLSSLKSSTHNNTSYLQTKAKNTHPNTSTPHNQKNMEEEIKSLFVA
jgi:hypothetical protein